MRVILPRAMTGRGWGVTKTEAFDLIDMAPNDSKPSRINPALTRADQVVHDRKRPRFEKPTTGASK